MPDPRHLHLGESMDIVSRIKRLEAQAGGVKKGSKPEVLTYDELAARINPGAKWADLKEPFLRDYMADFPDGLILVTSDEVRALVWRIIAGEGT